jgi:hypothetical protein
MKSVLRTSLVGVFALASVALAQPTLAANTNIVTIVSGDHQSATRSGNAVPGGIASFGPLTVLVTNLAGRPAAGVRVNFVCNAPGQMACQLQPAGGASAFGISDAQGHVVLNQMGGQSVSVYYAGGPFGIDVTGDTFAKVSFALTALTPTPAPIPVVNNPTLTIVSGNNQTSARKGSEPPGGVASFGALTVLLKDGSGKPSPNVPITFSCHAPAAMACQLTPSGADRGTLAVNTNAQGEATLNQMGGSSISAYYADAAFTMTATYEKTSVTFNLAVNPGAGPAFTNLAQIVSGDGQSVARTGSTVPGGIASFNPLTILVTDLSGKPASGVRVDWICAAPGQMACQLDPAGGQSATSTSDGSGHVTLNAMGGKSVSTYYATGAFAINVSGPTLKPIAFHLTAVNPPPVAVTYVSGAKLAVTSGNDQTRDRNGSGVPGGIATFGALQVKLTNASGAPIANAPVVFSCHVPGSWACQFDPSGADRGTMSVNTDANGLATLNRMGGNGASLYYGSGAFTITAAYGSIASTTFNLTVH